MDKKKFVSPLGPWGGWEGLSTETPSLAPILMPSAPGLMRIKKKKKTKKNITKTIIIQQKKNTSSHITISKYRQAMGYWRVPLNPHCSKFHKLEPTPRPPQTRDSRMKKKSMNK
jgi:hypothetical protein